MCVGCVKGCRTAPNSSKRLRTKPIKVNFFKMPFFNFKKFYSAFPLCNRGLVGCKNKNGFLKVLSLSSCYRIESFSLKLKKDEQSLSKCISKNLQQNFGWRIRTYRICSALAPCSFFDSLKLSASFNRFRDSSGHTAAVYTMGNTIVCSYIARCSRIIKKS